MDESFRNDELLKDPLVTVVLSVRNGEERIVDTVQSIQSQTLTRWRLVVVDDGSFDRTREILDQFAAKDDRIGVLDGPVAGLTAALRMGCDSVSTALIARMDCGDRCLPGRMLKQVEYLNSHPEVVAVGCGVQYIGPDDEALDAWCRDQTPQETTADLLEHAVAFVHPSVMFRTSTYKEVGGYRTAFRMAQDHDLWYRMAEVGLLGTVPEVLFEYRVEATGISPTGRLVQKRLGELARRAHLRRSGGQPDTDLASEAARLSHESITDSRTSLEKQRAMAVEHYHLGCRLAAAGHSSSEKYFRAALRSRPFWWRPRAKLLLARLLG